MRNGYITGYTGFIGSELYSQLNLCPTKVDCIEREHFDYFFHFGSPSSQVLFAEDDSHIEDTIQDFLTVVKYCKKHHLKLVYPSSANVYTNLNAYSKTKTAIENIVEAYGIPFACYRIFAGYGVGEAHKKHYSSIVYQWVKDALQDKPIVIYGDGEQTRDFVYIDDIVKTISSTYQSLNGYMDIGTGVNTPFTRIVEIISKVIGKIPQVEYIGAPDKYPMQTICEQPIRDFISVEEGIKRMIFQHSVRK